MDHRKIVDYIKIREQWRDALITKRRALSSIWRGLFEFGTSLAYYAIENYFFSNEITELYARNPNYKIIFYLSLFFGCWGILTSLLGIYNYFESSEQAAQLEQQVEEIEKNILKTL
jgi:hypothetical protein